MELKQVFIANLKKFRKQKRFSQIKLAEKCDTAASYIGEIEIGRKFPSIKMVEKIANALEVEPNLLFEDENFRKLRQEETRRFMAGLPGDVRQDLINIIKEAISNGLDKALEEENKDQP
jgi:transcriptional regulator with XRE-family HTH domain